MSYFVSWDVKPCSIPYLSAAISTDRQLNIYNTLTYVNNNMQRGLSIVSSGIIQDSLMALPSHNHAKVWT